MDTKKLNFYTKKRFWAGILPAQFLLFFLFSKIDFVVNLFERFFEVQKGIHEKIFASVPFSVGDVFYILLGSGLFFLTLKLFRKQTRNSAIFQFLILFNIFYFIYQIFWGMLYFQEPIIAKLSKEKITLKETKELTLKYLDRCKQTRDLVEEDRNGVFKIVDVKVIQKEILKKQNVLPVLISSKKGSNINAFKESLFKGVMSYSGILGYYNPFTAEAQYNSELPATYLPFTLAHESMHQFGFAREQEANFTGYLIGRNALNADLKYSTQYFVLKSLLSTLVEKNPEFVRKIVQNYSAGMKRDRLAEKQFVQEHEGFLDILFGFTNDLFLKTNQQEGSVTYSYFIDLLIRFERTQD